MKIVHFECGLGNQMVCYANYLLAKKYNPNDNIYMEGLVYMINNNKIGINQWNGYELDTLFGIKIPNIVDEIKDKKILLELMYSRYIMNGGKDNSESSFYSLIRSGLNIETDNTLVNANTPKTYKDSLIRFVTSTSNSTFTFTIKKFIYWLSRQHIKIKRGNLSTYYKDNRNYFFQLSFDIMKDITVIDDIKDEILQAFVFPPIDDAKNERIKILIESSSSVSIHARRSDFLQYNNDCYRYGYFKKAVNYVKKRVSNPVFFIFSEDSDWCKSNLTVLGLDEVKDVVYFIDWNNNETSFRDMQLMSLCKHNIITKSSFGWWAAYLNRNPNKIWCSQSSEYYSKTYF